MPREDVDVVWVPGAFELPAAAAAAAESGRYACLVALGAVIRGETPHFEYVAGAAANGLTDVSRAARAPGRVRRADRGHPAAGDRSGPAASAGNKGHEAAAAALGAADAIAQLRARHAAD